MLAVLAKLAAVVPGPTPAGKPGGTPGIPPLFLNDIGDVGEGRGGRGGPVKEFVMVTICCNGFGLPVLQFLGENGMRGGGGRFEPAVDCGVEGGEGQSSDNLLSSSL